MLQEQLMNNNWSSSMQCETVAEELNQSYDFMVQIHRDSDSATLITGYSGSDQYDSYFIVSKDDLIRFRDMIDDSIKKFDQFTEQLEMDKQIRYNLAKFISDISSDAELIDEMEIHIEYRDPIECSPYESLFGSVPVIISINKSLVNTYTIILSRAEFVSDIKELSMFDCIGDKCKFIIDNPDKKDAINEWYKFALRAANGDIGTGLPSAIAREDLEEIKNNMLSAIDAMYDKK